MAVDPIVLGIVEEFLALVSPLRRAVETERRLIALLGHFGWTPVPTAVAPLRAAFTAAGDVASIGQLAARMLNEGATVDAATVENLLTKMKGLVAGVRQFAQTPPVGLPAPFDSGSSFWLTFPGELFDDLLVARLRLKQPVLAALLQVAGVVVETPVAAAGARGAYVKRRIEWANVPRLFSEPTALLADTYAWNDQNKPFDHSLALACAQSLIGTIHAVTLGFPDADLSGLYYESSNPVLSAVRELRGLVFRGYAPTAGTFYELGLSVVPIPEAHTPDGNPVGLSFGSTFVGQAGIQVPAGPLTLSLSGGMEDASGPRIELRPGKVTTTLAAPAPTIDLGISLRYGRGFPTIVFGAYGSHRVQVKAVSVGMRVLGPSDAPEFRFELSLEDLEFIVQFANADGFLQRLFGTEPQRTQLSLTIRWSSETGLAFEGGTTVSVTLPLHLDLGPVQIDTATLEVSASAGKPVQIGFGLTGRAPLGPLVATVDRVGIRTTLRPVADDEPPGRLGNVDLDFGFKPPNGLGLSMDTALVKGGGYLYIDTVRGEYAGALELTFASFSLKAIGILSTKRPDGSEGWALLIIIYGQFPTPIQLSWGFTLSGIGGLIGLHHGCDRPQLESDMRTGASDAILFPKDPVGDAPAIIGQLRVTFPIRPDAMIVGPMLEIGWGTPSIIKVRLGVLIQLDHVFGGGSLALTQIVILGQLEALLPALAAPDQALLRLTIDFLGFIDLEQKVIGFAARLRDSRVAMVTLTGMLVIRITWGERPSFVLAAGGFHPRFTDLPPGLPAPIDRIGAGLSLGPVKLAIAGYFAVTSATVQAGALVTAEAVLGPLEIRGYFGFDTIFYFQPTFHFEIDVACGFSIRWQGFTLAGVAFQGSLSGPGHWHIVGKAEFTFLFWTVPIAIDEEFGESPEQLPMPGTDVLALLAEDIADKDHWSAQAPDGGAALVTFSAEAMGSTALAHPLSRLSFSQRRVPLQLQMDHFDRTSILGPTRMDVTEVKVGTKAVDPSFVSEYFARSSFIEMTSEEKLARPSFEPFPSGVDVASTEYRVAPDLSVPLDYETAYLSPEEPAKKLQYDSLRLGLAFNHLIQQARHAEVAQSRLRVPARLKPTVAARIRVTEAPLAAVSADALVPTGAGLAGAQVFSPTLAAQTAAQDGGTVIEAFEISEV